MRSLTIRQGISLLCMITAFLTGSSQAGHKFYKKPVSRPVIGSVSEFMPRWGNNIGPGSLIADAILAHTAYTGTQVSIISAAEVRSDLHPGTISKNDVRRLVLNTPLITFELTGPDLYSLIEAMATKKSASSGNTIGVHIAGMRFTFDEDAPSGQKVKYLEIGSLEKGYEPCDSSQMFRITSTIYVLDKLIALKGHRYLWEISVERRSLYHVLEQYIVSLSTEIENCPENRINRTDARIVVFSDPHYFDPALLISNGSAFQSYIAQDRKMIAESHSILLSAVSKIRNTLPDICIIPGDLTKDGELSSHSLFSQIITDSLISAGIKVFVAPGNHDVNNPESFAYNGSTTLRVENVNAEQFTEIYEHCGYGDAIARDTASLTYIAEPQNGLWVLSIDACSYDDNVAHSHTGGALSTGTLGWIIEKLDYARQHNITILGMMHHGVTEHYTGQTQVIMGMFKDYVLDDWMSVRDTLAAHGLKVVFTGHYHAQDIVKHTDTNGKFIFDIETGSTVTWPSPIRTVALSADRTLTIATSVIDTIDYPLPAFPFQDYAKNYLVQGLTEMVYYLLTMQFGVPAQQAQMLAPVTASAFAAHYGGDEQPGPVDSATYNQLKMSPDPLIGSMGLMLESLWTDLLPGDNNCIIDLQDGSVR